MAATVSLTPSQWKHALENTQKRVDAKAKECNALRTMTLAPDSGIVSMFGLPMDSIKDYLASLLAQAEIELEELQLRLTALQAAGNSIVVPR